MKCATQRTRKSKGYAGNRGTQRARKSKEPQRLRDDFSQRTLRRLLRDLCVHSSASSAWIYETRDAKDAKGLRTAKATRRITLRNAALLRSLRRFKEQGMQGKRKGKDM